MTSPRKWPWFLVLWLLAGAGAIALVWPLDAGVDAALDVTHNPRLHLLAWWCSKLGEGGTTAIAGIFLTVLLVRWNRSAIAAKVFFVLLSGELTGLAGCVLRVLIGRTRPTAHVPQGFYGIWYHGHWIIGRYEFSAFPSGHAATAAGLAAAAWLVHRGWGAATTAYALAVMWSRIALQSHHLSDIVASIVLAVPLAILWRNILLPSVEFHFVKLRLLPGSG
ncbi:MAG TPA: phosphatase PAP2 family protein [Candidatus Acidoferrales bacterium]|nr:phosphatase PAP2 family protein [Candidatus Acidoferrales bacterium]